MFVRRKKVKGNTYYQLVRNYREDGRHRQQVLCHLGSYKSLEEAIETESRIVENEGYEASFFEEAAQSIKNLCYRDYPEWFSGEFPNRRQAYLRWISSSKPPTRWQDELEVFQLVYEYHDHMEWARQIRGWVAAHKVRLDKFLECQRRYL